MAHGDAFRRPVPPAAPHPVVCPHCGRINTHHDDPYAPSDVVPDAVSLCWGCKKPSVFTEALDLRVPTRQEWAEILASPEYQTLVTAAALNPDSLDKTLLSAFLSLQTHPEVRARRDR